VNDVSK